MNFKSNFESVNVWQRISNLPSSSTSTAAIKAVFEPAILRIVSAFTLWNSRPVVYPTGSSREKNRLELLTKGLFCPLLSINRFSLSLLLSSLSNSTPSQIWSLQSVPNSIKLWYSFSPDSKSPITRVNSKSGYPSILRSPYLSLP